MKNLYALSRYLVGVLFIFCGLIKINDPVGTQIKLEEYFDDNKLLSLQLNTLNKISNNEIKSTGL